MTLNVGSITATLDLDRRPFERGFAAWRAGTRSAVKATSADLDAETRKQSERLGDRGTEAGKQYGEGFHRGADGKLRDALGRFVKESDDEGEKGGRRWSLGFLRGLRGGFDGDAASGLAKNVFSTFSSFFTISGKTAATAFSAQFVASVVAGLASGAAKVAHGAGSMLALLPAVALAGVTAMSAVKLAVSGVGDALEAAVTGDAKDFKEAIEGLSPSARGFAREVRGMRGDLKGLRSEVQERFFAPWEGQTSRLGKIWLPIMRRELGGVSGVVGQTVDRFAGWARQPAVILTLTSALGNARKAIGNVVSTGPGLAQAFLPLVQIGSTFLPRLTAGLGGAANKLALVATHAAATGKIERFIQGGLDKLGELQDTATQIWRIGSNIIAVFREFGSMDDVFGALGLQTGGVLDNLERLSERARIFFQSAEGGQVLTEMLSTVRSLLSATFGSAARLASLAGRIFAPLLPDIAKLNEALANFQLGLADSLEPTLRGIASVLKVIVPPLTSLLELMTGNKIVMGAMAGIVVALFAAWAAGAAKSRLETLSANSALVGAAAGLGALATMAGQLEAENQAKAMKEMAEGLAAIDYAATTASKSAIRNAEAMGLLDEAFSAAEESGGDASSKLVDLMEAAGVGADTVAHYRSEVEQAAAAQANQTDATSEAEDAMRDYNDEVDRLLQKQMDVPEAVDRLTLSLEDAVEHFTRQKEEAGAAGLALEGNSAAAAENRDVMRGLVEDGAGVIQSMADQGATSQELRDEIGRQKLQLMGLGQRFGLTSDQVAFYTGMLDSIPTRVSTNVGVSGLAGAMERLRQFGLRIQQLDGSTINVAVNARATSTGRIGGVPVFHDGGVVPGPRGQEVAAILQAGERVLPLNDPLNTALDRDQAMLARTGSLAGDAARMRSGPGMAGGGVSTVDITIHGTGLLEGLREQIQVRGGGNVQRALGQN